MEGCRGPEIYYAYHCKSRNVKRGEEDKLKNPLKLNECAVKLRKVSGRYLCSTISEERTYQIQNPNILRRPFLIIVIAKLKRLILPSLERLSSLEILKNYKILKIKAYL